MASASAVAMATPQSAGAVRRPLNTTTSASGAASLFNPMRLPARSAVTGVAIVRTSSGIKRRLDVRATASMKEKAVSGLTAAAVAAALLVPDVAEAAGSGLSPSLKNFLLSITAGGVVLGAIIGAVLAVSNFDPVKRT